MPVKLLPAPILWAFATLFAASLLESNGGFSGVLAEELTCDWSSCTDTERDPNLKEFTYDVGDGPQKTWVYVEPDVSSFYRKSTDEAPKKRFSRVKPAFNGLAGKFINMSNKPLDFYWESAVGGTAHLMRHYTPFSTGGTGTFPTHRFFFATEEEPTVKVHLMIVQEYPTNLYIYNPYLVEGDPEETEKNLQKHLNAEEREQYDMWTKTLAYNEQYKAFTGRSYLANFGDNGPRAPPIHFMWRADYFGQEHWVTTKETHFVDLPPKSELGKITEVGTERILKESDPRHFQEYRVKDEVTQEPLEFMNMTLTVLSCAPRVFEIRDFMSQTEVDHILELAGGIRLAESTTGDVGSNGNERRQSTTRATKVRTSRNSWVAREKSPIIDAIYRRAADLARIDEALLRRRSEEEAPYLKTKSSIAETLQLVHYDKAQEYTAHHDFGYSHIRDNVQAARFATILFYLNDGMIGGETAFPRWVNGKSFHELKVKPEVGKAILFYDQLPDGNLDDFSQHSAKPIIQGEKWLINLWIWDPKYEG